MDDHLELSKVANLIADPTRAEILLILMDGRSFPVSEIAAMTHVSTPTVSHHLSMLVEGGLVSVIQQGRHRYHGLTSTHVAQMIESLGVFAGGRTPELTGTRKVLQGGRSCYNHLAGELGVQVCRSLVASGVISSEGPVFKVLSPSFMADLGVDPGLTGKVCIDWTEQVPHIGGKLGSALFDALLEKKWIQRGEIPRQVVLTTAGKARFAEAFPLA